MVQFFKKVANDIFVVSFELFKIMIPTLLLVKIAEIYGLVAVLTNLFAPIMTMMGLPAEMALAITTTMLTNPYAGIIVLASTPGIENLTVAQTTILASLFPKKISSSVLACIISYLEKIKKIHRIKNLLMFSFIL